MSKKTTTKAAVKSTSNKAKPVSVHLTREEARQAARLRGLVDEFNSVKSRLAGLRGTLSSTAFNKMPLIDRYLTILMATSLETYQFALGFKADWENTRIRTTAGEKLSSRDFLTFWKFLHGDVKLRKVKVCTITSKAAGFDKPCKKTCTAVVEAPAKSACKDKCSDKCSDKCKDKCTKPCKKPCKKATKKAS